MNQVESTTNMYRICQVTSQHSWDWNILWKAEGFPESPAEGNLLKKSNVCLYTPPQTGAPEFPAVSFQV